MGGLKTSSLIYDIKYKTTIKIYDVEYDMIVEVGIIFQIERKSLREFLIFLVIIIVLGKMFK